MSPWDTPHGEQRSRAAAEGCAPVRATHTYETRAPVRQNRTITWEHPHTTALYELVQRAHNARVQQTPEHARGAQHAEEHNKKRARAQTAPQRGCTRASAARYTRNEGICTRYEQEQWPRPPVCLPVLSLAVHAGMLCSVALLLYCPAAYSARDYVRRLLYSASEYSLLCSVVLLPSPKPGFRSAPRLLISSASSALLYFLLYVLLHIHYIYTVEPLSLS